MPKSELTQRVNRYSLRRWPWDYPQPMPGFLWLETLTYVIIFSSDLSHRTWEIPGIRHYRHIGFPKHSFPLSCPSWLEVRTPTFPTLDLRGSAPHSSESQQHWEHTFTVPAPKPRMKRLPGPSFERPLSTNSLSSFQSNSSTARS